MTNLSANETVSTWLVSFTSALRALESESTGKNNIKTVTDLFTPNAFWRDILAFTHNIHTAEGISSIERLVTATARAAKSSNWRIDCAPSYDANTPGASVSAWLRFDTCIFHSRGRVTINQDGLASNFLTAAVSIIGHEERAGATREYGAPHGPEHLQRMEAGKCFAPWGLRRAAERIALANGEEGALPFVLIIGGGQAGVSLAARLKRLDVPTLVVERRKRAGDSWRSRYDSLYLHDAVWYDHFPYLPFPDHWPVYSSKDQMGDWIESYVRIMDIDYWTSSECISASFDNDLKQWSVIVNKLGKKLTLHPKHVVLATGLSGFPNMPNLPGISDFAGDVVHSSEHKSSKGYVGKKAVVVGSNNSAHDICADLHANGAASVTMVQRSATTVIKCETANKLMLAPLYSEDAVKRGVTVDDADLLFASIPYAQLPARHIEVMDIVRKRDAEFYEGLTKAGFHLDFGEDDAGHFMKYLRRGSGYYIDVGASDLVSRGDIALAHGQVVQLTRGGVILSDGNELPAELVVFATGYGPMNEWASQIISPEVARRVGRCWGLGSGTKKDPGPWEGELRNMWKPTRQEGLWFHGGNLHQSRHYSLVVALQLKLRHLGMTPRVYAMPDAHHPC